MVLTRCDIVNDKSLLRKGKEKKLFSAKQGQVFLQVTSRNNTDEVRIVDR